VHNKKTLCNRGRPFDKLRATGLNTFVASQPVKPVRGELVEPPPSQK
jgi:hypothetical protein